VVKPDQVWSTDITYIRLAQGFAYLVAILDWFSRYVLSFRLSNSLREVRGGLSQGYQTMAEAQAGLKRYFQFYNNKRFHQSLGYRTPKEVYVEKVGWEKVEIAPR